ncbi:MAG: hypothetical protein U0903_05725 [Planctomycetales bacterium]
MQAIKIPEAFAYHAVPQLRAEAKEKLLRIQPRDLAQAGRISGITPADLAILMLYLREPERPCPAGTLPEGESSRAVEQVSSGVEEEPRAGAWG